MRASTAGGKASGKDIVVTFGGLTWTPTYLSKTKPNEKNENGDLILTLWLTNSAQLSGGTYDEGANKKFDSKGTATWNAGGGYADKPTDNYPDAMYGTSYMNAVVLNNGGHYKPDYSVDEVTKVEKNPNHVFAKFTTDEKLTKYIATPSEVAWQEYGQYKRIYSSYTLPNENWARDIPVSGTVDTDPTETNYNFAGSSSYGYYNYASKNYSDQWADSTLWLPSMSETGDTNEGIWKTSKAQRSNTYDSWLRSGYDYLASYAYYLASAGSPYSHYVVAFSLAVRPSLHLNLNSAAKSLTPLLLDERVSTSPSSPDGIYKVDKGSGVVEFHITSPKGMEYLRSYSRENLKGAYSTKWIFILDTDIDMNGYNNSLILGYSTSPFQGTFDGKGHTLSNVREPFYYVQNSTIQNLKLQNCNTLINSAEVKVDIKNIIMTGQCSPNSAIFDSAREGAFNVENVQLYPTNEMDFLCAKSMWHAEMVFKKFFVIAPKIFSSDNGGGVLSSVTLEDSFIHLLQDSQYGGLSFRISLTMKNTVIKNQGGLGLDYGITLKRVENSCVIAQEAASVSKSKITEATGFYTSGSDGIKIYDSNFTNSLWCQSDSLAGGLPQLKQFLAGGSEVANLNPSFNMRTWASKQMT